MRINGCLPRFKMIHLIIFNDLSVQTSVQFPGNYYLRRTISLIFLIMISRRKELKLINIYMYICDLYEQDLKYYC